MRTHNGSIISHNTVTSPMRHYRDSMFNHNKIQLAQVEEVIYQDDARNATKNNTNKQVLYTCSLVGGKESGKKIFNVHHAKPFSGKNNFIETILTPNEQASDQGENQTKKAPNLQQGDLVLMARVNGYEHHPVIIGTMPTYQQGDAATKADGSRTRGSFNGLSFSIDKDGALNISFGGGPAGKDGKASNSAAAGTGITIDKDGSLTIVNNSGQTLKMDRAGKSITFGATGNEMIIDTGGGKVSISGQTTIDLSSNSTVNIAGNGTVNLKGSTTFINGGGSLSARMGDNIIATGVDSHGDTVVVNGQIINGSSTVLVGG